jgi:prepilin-type N-terminal cleavage/methylation domain-containing protein
VAVKKFAFGRRLRIRLVRGTRRNGFTMLEVTMAMSVLLVAMVAVSATTLRCHALRRVNREHAVAQNAVLTIAERIQAASRLAHEDAAGWGQNIIASLSAGGGIGNTFDVPELTTPDGAAHVGSITVVTNEAATDATLHAQLGMPRDLDGDGLIDNASVGNSARLLPVIIRAQWKGVGGTQTFVHPFYVLGY